MSSHHHMFDDMSGGGGGGTTSGHAHHHHSSHHGHGHSRGQGPHRITSSSSSSSNCQLRGKWEILLVFLVIFSGIVLTTLAVIKAKEKRNTQQQQIPAENTVLPVIERASFSPPSTSSLSPKSSTTSSISKSQSNLSKTSIAGAIIPLSEKPNRSKQSKKHRNNNNGSDSKVDPSLRNRYQVEGGFGDQSATTNSNNNNINKQTRQRKIDTQTQQQQPQQNQQQLPQQPSPTASPTSVSLPYDFAADSSTLIKVRPDYRNSGTVGSMLVHYDGLPAYPGPAGQSVVLPKAELTVNGAGFVRQYVDTTHHGGAAGRGGGADSSGSVLGDAVNDLTPEGSSRHATRVSGQRPGGALSRSGGNRFVVDPNANLLSPQEIKWLQHNRPEIFQSSHRAITQQQHAATAAVRHQSHHSAVPHLTHNYRQHQLHRMRRQIHSFTPHPSPSSPPSPMSPSSLSSNRANNKSRKLQTSASSSSSRRNQDKHHNHSYRRGRSQTAEDVDRPQQYNANVNSGQNLYSVASSQPARKIEKREKRYGILGSGNFEIIRGGILPDEPSTRRPKAGSGAQKKSSGKSKAQVLPESENSLAGEPVDENQNDVGSGEENNNNNNNTASDEQNDGNGEGDANGNVNASGDDSNNSESESDGAHNDENGNDNNDDNNNQSADGQNDGEQEPNDNDEENGGNNPFGLDPLNLDIFGNQDPFAGLQSQRSNNVL